jgi:RNA polymerase sigma-70 factor (ECF subfamily)
MPALVMRLKRGDSEAYEDLIQAYGQRLRAVIGRYLRSWDRVEDALQDVWLSVHRGIGGFNGRSALTTWLHRVAVNAALMVRRAESRRPAVHLDALDLRADARALPPGLAPAPRDSLSDAEDVARLQDAVLGHPDMELRVAGCSIREIAHVFGICNRAVKTLLAHSRRSIAHRCGLESWLRTRAHSSAPRREGPARAVVTVVGRRRT